MEILKTKSIKTAVELLNAVASELQLATERKLTINSVNGKMSIIDGEKWEHVQVKEEIEKGVYRTVAKTIHTDGKLFSALGISVDYDKKYKGIILSSDNQKVWEAVNVFFANNNKPLLAINQEAENQKIEAEINKVTKSIGAVAKTEVNDGEAVTYCGYFVLVRNYQRKNNKIENLLKNHNVIKSGLIQKKEINNKYVDFDGFIVNVKYLKLAFKLLEVKKAVFDVIKLKGGGGCLRMYSPDNVNNFAIITFVTEAKIKEIVAEGNTTIQKLKLQIANSEPAAIEKKEVATKTTKKSEPLDNATTVEELTDCNIDLDDYGIGHIMQPPTGSTGGSLRGYKEAKKATPAKAKKSEPVPAPVKSEFDFATVATLDSLELLARRERDLSIITNLAKDHKIKANLSGVWVWFCSCDNDKVDDLSIDLLDFDIDLHFACDKKCYCWHEPEDGSGYGKQEQTADHIKTKYGNLKIA